jgi:L-lactate dehydrogenase complex protein LldF
MSEIYQKFMSDAEAKAFDHDHRQTIQYNISKYDIAVTYGKKQYLNLELARRQAALKKFRCIENLENVLKDFEQNFIKKGGKVLWAQDAEEARGHVLSILQKHQVKMLVKSKSMVTEEIELDAFLKQHGIESIETDLGEYIVQISNDRPYHIVTPVMHKSAKDIAAIFHEKFNLDPHSTPQQITSFVRKTLREKFSTAQAGITGANFLISQTGSVALTENEGNGVLSVSMPPVHIVVAGIEKVIENIEDLHLFWPLLATFGTGQNITAYNSIISGPRQKDEFDGPTDMYVILMDNGRSNLLAAIPQRRALSCIRCGACLNACPVYHNIGGHSYGTVYSGPIGAVITPHLKPMKDYKHLSFATSLCGKCTEVCPVNINLHHLLLYNRNLSVEQKLSPKIENYGMFAWKKFMLNRKWINKAGAGMKNYVLKKLFGSTWGKRRDLPPIAPNSFGKLWEQRNNPSPGNKHKS